MPADTMQAAFGDRSAAEESQVRPTRDGKIYCSGTSPFGAMGLNVAGARCAEPRLVTTLVDKQICQISCGWRHTLNSVWGHQQKALQQLRLRLRPPQTKQAHGLTPRRENERK